MTAFQKGFTKTAASTEGVWNSIKRVGIGATRVAKGMGSGISSAGGQTVGDALRLKGLSHLSDAYKSQNGLKGLKTKAGQRAYGQALGKAAPSIAAAGAYGVGLKKLYDKTMGGSPDQNAAGYYY